MTLLGRLPKDSALLDLQRRKCGSTMPASMTDSIPAVGERPLIEMGLVLVGRFKTVERDYVDVARQKATEQLQRMFADFTWRMPLVSRVGMTVESREEPVSFLAQGLMERDANGWDFVVVLPGADLIVHDKPFVLAAVSRTLDLAVISTTRIDRESVGSTVDEESRVKQIADRIQFLILRCLGHLNGLESVALRNNLMSPIDEPPPLDLVTALTTEQTEIWHANLQAIADARLEEQPGGLRQSPAMFLVRAARAQWREIIAGVLDAKPWQFPMRLSRLTTAAVSALLVMLMTAETWDMAMSQTTTSVGVLLLTAVMSTTAYVTARQRLLVWPNDQGMTEQIAVSNLTATLTVLTGLGTSLLMLFTMTLALSMLLFPRTVVDGWTASVDERLTWSHFLLFSGVVSALSLGIGALGAAFEDESHFRHVALIDEEL